MKRSFTLVIIVIVAALLAAPAWNFQDKKPIAAYIMKVVNNVERRTGSTQGWSKAVLLSELKAGYEVRTQEKSFAMIKFADESKVSVREKSIITISGEVSGGKILNRDVYIERGRTSFEVKKQETEQFRFTSPISVASIRGTEGGTGFDPGLGQADITIITGIAEFSHTSSGCKVDVTPGMTGRVDRGGGCKVDTASHNELNNNNPHSNVNQGVVDSTQQGGNNNQPPPGSSTKFTLTLPTGATLTSGVQAQLNVALSNPPVEIQQVTLFYRNQGDPSYKQLQMTVKELTATGTVPASDIHAGTAKKFEYYFSMRGSNGTTYTFPDTNPDSSPYILPVKPKVVYLKIPVTTPTGEQRYLQISYEE
ncbi:MAG TPA: FecR family protein [Bacteroidota bacterium]|nr:FecR family protein [Bacteroidota bacterium]